MGVSKIFSGEMRAWSKSFGVTVAVMAAPVSGKDMWMLIAGKAQRRLIAEVPSHRKARDRQGSGSR
jgi:hypothetical protein